MGKLYIIRHGTTDANLAYRFQGQIDTDINDKGRAQAQEVAEHFKNIRLDAIYASPLKRAYHTAQPLAATHNLEIIKRPELIEISFGDWENKYFDEINDASKQELDLFFAHPAQCNIPGGETLAQVAKRVGPFFEELLCEIENKDIAIVTHGGIIRVLLCLFLNMDLDNLWYFGVRNCSTTTIIKWRDYNRVLEYTNDIHYLTV